MARSPAQRVIGTLLFLAALVALLGFYFLVFAESQQIDAVPGVGQLNLVAVAVAVVLAVVALVLIILLASRGRRHAEAESADEAGYFVPPEPAPVQPYGPSFEEVDDDLVVYDVWRLPVARRAWTTEDRDQSTFYFPLHVEGGVYVNDYIPIGGDRRLKLRTLLAGPPDIGSAAFTIQGAPARARNEHERMEPSQRPQRPERAEEPRLAEPDPSPWDKAGGADDARWDGPPAAQESRWDEPRRPERPRRDVPGDSFMRELERRFAGRDEAPQVAVAKESAYYDYPGDIHDVIDVEGIGTVYAERLRQIGVRTTARLCYEDAGQIANRIDVPKRTVESWQAMSQLMKVSGIGPQYAEALARSGIDMEALRRRDPARMADEVNRHLDSIGASVVGQRITERRIAAWQEAAKAMRRVRMRIPEK